jgi:hypothetical protein
MAVLHFGSWDQTQRGTLRIDGNRYLAHFQVAVFESFREGRGFMVSLFGGRDDDDNPIPRTTYWFSPGMPLHWIYDPDEPPVEIDDAFVEQIRSGINHPMGVLIWPTNTDVNVGARRDERGCPG